MPESMKEGQSKTKVSTSGKELAKLNRCLPRRLRIGRIAKPGTSVWLITGSTYLRVLGLETE
jgi:hypothetical protein